LALLDGIVFAERVSLKLFVKEYAPQVRVASEHDAEHVPNLAFEPVRRGPQWREGINWLTFFDGNFKAKSMLVRHRIEVVNDRESGFYRRSGPGVLIRNVGTRSHRYSRGSEKGRRRPVAESGVIHCRNIDEKIHLERRIVFYKAGNLEQGGAGQNDRLIAPASVSSQHGIRKSLPHKIDQSAHI
jgi:hypothetical protein